MEAITFCSYTCFERLCLRRTILFRFISSPSSMSQGLSDLLYLPIIITSLSLSAPRTFPYSLLDHSTGCLPIEQHG